MSWYLSRTDGELVALARQGDRRARGVLLDRTLLPASRVAAHLEPDADTAVAALVAAYGDAFRRVAELADDEAFLPVLLDRLDHRAPFPLDPATHAPLDPIDRDRVRAAVLGATRRRRAVPLAAVAAAAALVAVALTVDGSTPIGPVVEDSPRPATRGSDIDDDLAGQEPTAEEQRASPLPDPDSAVAGEDATEAGGDDPAADGEAVEVFDGGTGTGELAETR